MLPMIGHGFGPGGSLEECLGFGERNERMKIRVIGRRISDIV